uniref:RNase_PH domain-containing protein n=1 Tax=Steinernema glaseri TaxID=37863 RepID=A0A1I7ZQJ6_9BILA
MEVELHCTGRADGSCLNRQGEGIYLAAVHGPRQCPSRKRDYEELSIGYAFRPQGKNQKRNEYLMRTVLDHAVDKSLFPRNQITCNVQELEKDRDNTAPAVNALCLALLDAAVPLKHMFCGVYVSVEQQSAEKESTEKESCSFIFVFKPSLTTGGDLIGTVNNGKFTMAQYEQALTKGKECCLSVFDFYREAIGKKITNALSYGLSAKNLRKLEKKQH